SVTPQEASTNRRETSGNASGPIVTRLPESESSSRRHPMDTDDRADHQIALLCEAIDQIDGQIDALWCEVGGQDPAQRSYPKWIGQEFDRLHADRPRSPRGAANGVSSSAQARGVNPLTSRSRRKPMSSLKRWVQVGQGQFIKWTEKGQQLEGIWRGQKDGQ